jgi:NAD(P)-dependent dehydrogenase (short-subunit alcohol dehydrogenase family)
MKLTDSVALITGAASGIGRACAQRFLEEGATVLACDIDRAGLERLAAESDQSRLHTAVCDVTKRADVEASVEQALSIGGKLDCLVNSAGITPRTLPPEADFEERWDAVMEVNAKGVYLMSYAALAVMRPAGGGAIVNLVSIMGMVGYPTSLPFSDGFTAYPHSKGAVVQMTREMGVRFGVEGVRINAVAPGFVYSPLTENVVGDPEVHAEMRRLHPMGRMGQPEEIAAVVAFLASDDASFVTASVWPVDGGYTAQ